MRKTVRGTNVAKKTKGRAPRDKPQQARSVVGLWDWGNDSTLACSGYTSLRNCPEVTAAIDRIAGLIGSMTICLMQSGEYGDTRIRNQLSRLVDIEPNAYMNRANLIRWAVREMLLTGNALINPETENGYLRQLIPIPSTAASYVPKVGWGYSIMVSGIRVEPENMLHFAYNPDDQYPWRGRGHTVALREVANNLKQAAATEKGFMESKWKPSLIIKVDALTDEFSSPEGRKKLLSSYIESGSAGEPWLIPAEQFSVEQVKPLTLADLALADFVTLDKRTVASILGVPAFVLGVGDFKREEWNNFISSTIMPVAKIIEQELTRKLLYSDKLFFRFSSRSLYSYDLKDMASIADDQYIRGIMTGNEVRDWLGLSPLDGLNQLVILENYIPQGMIGSQKKLIQEGGNEE